MYNISNKEIKYIFDMDYLLTLTKGEYMKKLLLASILGVAFMTSDTVLAQVSQKGGFKGPSAAYVATVADVAAMPDDQHVVLDGYIEQHLRGDKYLFQDGTGKITVEIDDDDWHGLTVEPKTKVQIKGEVDKGLFEETKIDVDSVQLAK